VGHRSGRHHHQWQQQQQQQQQPPPPQQQQRVASARERHLGCPAPRLPSLRRDGELPLCEVLLLHGTQCH